MAGHMADSEVGYRCHPLEYVFKLMRMPSMQYVFKADAHALECIRRLPVVQVLVDQGRFISALPQANMSFRSLGSSVASHRDFEVRPEPDTAVLIYRSNVYMHHATAGLAGGTGIQCMPTGHCRLAASRLRLGDPNGSAGHRLAIHTQRAMSMTMWMAPWSFKMPDPSDPVRCQLALTFLHCSS